LPRCSPTALACRRRRPGSRPPSWPTGTRCAPGSPTAAVVGGGRRHGLHALTFGYILGEVVRRVTGRPIARVLREEVAGPLGIADSLFFGVPAQQLTRVARLEDGNWSTVRRPGPLTRCSSRPPPTRSRPAPSWATGPTISWSTSPPPAR
jgi:CubicO group peptidase (beta-lactamase class C family)